MITVSLCRNKFVTIRTHSSNSQFMKDFNTFAATFMQNIYTPQKQPFKDVLQIGVLKNFAIGIPACNFIKKRLQHRRFPVDIAKYLSTAFLQNTSGRDATL